MVAALAGTITTSLFLLGLLERRDRTILRMGWDSFAVLIVYLSTLAVLWGIRPEGGDGAGG